MGLNEIKDKVEPLNSLKKESKTFSNDLRKHQSKKIYDNIKTESNDKAKAINYYDNLSESDKVAFQKELQKKKRSSPLIVITKSIIVMLNMIIKELSMKIIQKQLVILIV